MTAKLDYAWKLREVMATRGLFQTTHLRPGWPSGAFTCPTARSTGW